MLRGGHGHAARADWHPEVTRYVRPSHVTPDTIRAVRSLSFEVRSGISTYGSVAQVLDKQTGNIRNDLYLISAALRRMDKSRDPLLATVDDTIVKEYRSSLDRAAKVIQTRVKASVALSLGLGTMVGWKRTFVTVGENRHVSPDLWAGILC